MLRAERSQAVCSQCQANTGGRTIRDVVRLIVSLATGGSGGLRVLCDPHAGQYAASLASECEDGRCSSCGCEGSMFVIEMEPRRVRLCRQRCAPQALLLLDAALKTRDRSWSQEWDPHWQRPSWWGSSADLGPQIPKRGRR